ncbi:uncharacterized protein C16orf90 homolog [Sorex fumeus]|uniref:uncharacterized protein C16orf90 homolog n=1 Tax=Sorex fumeus TaxID=62283 RepID=UPI0024AD774A|nr:uncharacterized protein C16orf90 homolog [Sorex fumeus]
MAPGLPRPRVSASPAALAGLPGNARGRDGARRGPNNAEARAGRARTRTVHQPPSCFPFTDAVSWARGHPSHPDTPPNIYEGGLGAQQQCSSAQGSKPKNFRLRHLRGLAFYLPGPVRPAGQCESHWLGRLMAEGGFPQLEAAAWPLAQPPVAVGPGNSHHSALLEAPVPGESLGNPASSSSMDQAKDVPSQPSPPEGLGLRPKRSWGTSEESTCPLCKRTRSGAPERP